MPKGKLLDPKRTGRVSLKKVRAQEHRTAKETGGRTTPGSGNQDVKGDCQSRTWLIENKRTDAQQFILRKADLKKAAAQAAAEGKDFALQLDFGGGSQYRFVVIRMDTANNLGIFKDVTD